MNKNFFLEFLEMIFFMLFFVRLFQDCSKIVLFPCGAYNTQSEIFLPNLSSKKSGVFIFSNYVVVAPIFAADYLQNSTLPSAKYP